MSVMDKLINAMKFNDDEDFDEDEEYEDCSGACKKFKGCPDISIFR